MAQPRITSSISLGSSCGTRSSAPLIATAASSSGRVARSVPCTRAHRSANGRNYDDFSHGVILLRRGFVWERALSRACPKRSRRVQAEPSSAPCVRHSNLRLVVGSGPREPVDPQTVMYSVVALGGGMDHMLSHSFQMNSTASRISSFTSSSVLPAAPRPGKSGAYAPHPCSIFVDDEVFHLSPACLRICSSGRNVHRRVTSTVTVPGFVGDGIAGGCLWFEQCASHLAQGA